MTDFLTIPNLRKKVSTKKGGNMKVTKEIKKAAWGKVVDIVVQIVDKGPVRKFLIKRADEKLWDAIVEEDDEGLRPAQELKYA
ncbi:MAG: hypothetical protein DRG50_06690, partial [Deltaproteobacteria bacterium]